jgi:hypothetical protein
VGHLYPLPADDSTYHITYPVAQFDHDEGTAISGGFEYKGAAIDELRGKYVFGDIGTGRLFFIRMDDVKLRKQATIGEWHIAKKGQLTSLRQLCGNDRVDMRFGADHDGELYLFTKADGKIYKLVKNETKAKTVSRLKR